MLTADEWMTGDVLRQTVLDVTNAVFSAMLVIGRQVSDVVVQEDMKHRSFEVVRGDGDKPLIQVEFKGETKRFTPEEISSMLTKMRETAEAFMEIEGEKVAIMCIASFNVRSGRRRGTWG